MAQQTETCCDVACQRSVSNLESEMSRNKTPPPVIPRGAWLTCIPQRRSRDDCSLCIARRWPWRKPSSI